MLGSMMGLSSSKARFLAPFLLAASSVALASVGVACSSSSNSEAPSSSDDDGGDTDGGEGTDSGDGDDGGALALGWTIRSHSCPGPNRTDALFVDDDGTLWVGCGTAATGYGLFSSKDQGLTWTQVLESPPGTLSKFRIFSIERGPDAELYVGGVNESDESKNRVVRIDTSADPVVVTPVLVSVPQLGRQFSVGTFRQLSDGRAVAESLNGTDALYRPTEGAGSSAEDWTIVDVALSGGGAAALHILDLVVFDDRFYGAGSSISSPPYVFLPPRTASEPYALERIELPRTGAWTGEMWGVAANAERVVVVGVNQDDDTGRIYVSGDDPYEAASYKEINLSEVVGEATRKTWARGVCQKGDRVVVVGERQPLRGDTGLVVLSDDGGQTFVNMTPEGVTASVSKCTVLEDGTVIVAGAAGFVGVYR